MAVIVVLSARMLMEGAGVGYATRSRRIRFSDHDLCPGVALSTIQLILRMLLAVVVIQLVFVGTR